MNTSKINAFRLLAVAALLAVATPAHAKRRHSHSSESDVVLIKTTLGDIKVQLDPKSAPVTTKNFLRYVDEKFYDGTIFHRVIPNFMIQGGGLDKDLNEKSTHDPIQNESQNGLKNDRGTIAMARTADPNSAAAQFFINVKDNNFLNYPNGGGGYAVFGKVIWGMEIVDQIVNVPTTTVGEKGMQNVPQTPVIIESIRRVKE